MQNDIMNTNNYLYSILTVNTNHYEILHEVKNPNPNVEYVCVTDDPELKSDTWKIIYKENIWFLYVKHHVFEFVSTDVCVWLDGSYQIISDFTEDIMMPFINSDKEMMISIHNLRTNLYDEMCQWWLGRNISDNNIKALCQILNNNDMSGKEALFQTSCYIVKNTDNIKILYDNICNVENACSIDEPYRDDQVITSLCIYRLFFQNWNKFVLMDFSTTSNNRYFYMCVHGSNQPLAFKAAKNICFDKEQHLYKIGQPFD